MKSTHTIAVVSLLVLTLAALAAALTLSAGGVAAPGNAPATLAPAPVDLSAAPTAGAVPSACPMFSGTDAGLAKSPACCPAGSGSSNHDACSDGGDR